MAGLCGRREFGSSRRKQQRKLRRDKERRKRSLRSPWPTGGADSGHNGSRMHLREADLEAAISRGSGDLRQGSCALGPKPLGLSVLTQQRRGPRSPSAGRHHPLCPRGATSGCHLCGGGTPRPTTATIASTEVGGRQFRACFSARASDPGLRGHLFFFFLGRLQAFSADLLGAQPGLTWGGVSPNTKSS